MLNVCARNMGWLFEDLKRLFERVGRAIGVPVRSTEEPLPDASAWIFFRPEEAGSCPDLSRAVIQLHDLYGDTDAKGNPGRYRYLREAGALSLLNPDQIEILRSAGVQFRRHLLQPIGALEIFGLRERLPDVFTVGWVGRPVHWQGRDIKRPGLFVDAVLESSKYREVRVIIVGSGMEPYANRLRAEGVSVVYHRREEHGIGDYPSFYKEMDCLLITSEVEAGPATYFEAMATGIPVVSTPVGWPAKMIQEGHNGFLRINAAGLSSAIDAIAHNRDHWLSQSQVIRDGHCNLTTETWARLNLGLAQEIAR